ncbi:MAG: DUF805 domain-containing protein [Pseudomonadota bacterium]
MAYVKIMPTLSLFGRSLIDWVHIGGRARRSELLLYGMLSTLFVLTITDAASPWLHDWRDRRLLEIGLGAVQALPMMAIFVRRLHDQDRTGWWVLLMPPVLLDNLWREWRFATYDLTRLLDTPDPLPVWAGVPLVLGIWLLYLLPGTIGPNRYGPDPREAERTLGAVRRAAS